MQSIEKYLFVVDGDRGASPEGKRRIVALLARADRSLAEISGALDISIPTATKLVAELVAEGVLRDLGKAETSGGRRPNIFGLAENDFAFLGIDGSQKILCNLRGEIVDPAKKHTVIAVGATSEPAEKFDVPLFTIAPAAARCRLECGEAENLLYIDLGNTYSAGIIINGVPYTGHSGMAGTFLETKLIDDKVAEVVENALNDDNNAIHLVDAVASRAGAEIAAAVALLNPEEVVIGGPFSAAGDYLMLPLQATIHRHTPKKIYGATRFRLAAHNDNAAALGAALTAIDKTLGTI